MESYQREWFVYPGGANELPPDTRLHVAFTADCGTPVRFLVQLEYWNGSDWLQVARFDHDADGPAYRDVEWSGLHLDVYDPRGEQVEKIANWPPQPPNVAMGEAEDYLRRNAEYYVRRFESWL